MAFDTIRAGIKVFTNGRATQSGGVVGGTEGVIDSVIFHPVSRAILAVLINTGSDDPDDRVRVNPRHLRQAAA